MVARLLTIMLLFCGASAMADSPLQTDKGVIRDSKCAVAVGIAILGSVYGDEHVRRAGPYRAKLDKDEWQVEADLPTLKPGEVRFGGGYWITLSRKDGRVIDMGFDE